MLRVPRIAHLLPHLTSPLRVTVPRGRGRGGGRGAHPYLREVVTPVSFAVASAVSEFIIILAHAVYPLPISGSLGYIPLISIAATRESQASNGSRATLSPVRMDARVDARRPHPLVI
jgi:hypothetical protein